MSKRELTAAQRKYFRPYRPQKTDRDWDLLRMRAPELEILKLPISPLFLEVKGKPWPGKRRSMAIASYFDMNYEELISEVGMKPKEIDLLIELVSDVIQTEKSEKDMVGKERIKTQTVDFFFRTLEKFDIRPELPIDFISLEPDTLDFLINSSVDDLESVLRKAVELLDKKVLSGDLKLLFNAVATESPQLMSRFLPIVPGERGVQPWKAISIAVKKIPAELRQHVSVYFEGNVAKVPEEDRADFEKICKRFDMISFEFRSLFPEESSSIRDGAEDSDEILQAIHDPEVQALAAKVISGRTKKTEKAGEGKSEKPSGFMRSIFGRAGAN